MEKKILNNSVTILQENCTIGFQSHINLKPNVDVKSQLNRRFLYHRFLNGGNPLEVKRIIETNSSFRLYFGWAFESPSIISLIVEQAFKELSNRYPIVKINSVTDLRSDWIGFLPYNVFERSVYENLSVEELIDFNNSLCNFQIEIVQFIVDSSIYRNHLILKDNNYRYDFFKQKRKNKEDLISAFHYFMDALENINILEQYPMQLIDEMIGSHFLYYPDTFFELINFYTLKGKLNGK